MQDNKKQQINENNDDIIEITSVDKNDAESHVSAPTPTHGEDGRHDPKPNPKKINLKTNNKPYKTFASKDEFTLFVDERIKKTKQENLALKKQLEQAQNAKKQDFTVDEKPKKQPPKIKIFGVI